MQVYIIGHGARTHWTSWALQTSPRWHSGLQVSAAASVVLVSTRVGITDCPKAPTVKFG